MNRKQRMKQFVLRPALCGFLATSFACCLGAQVKPAPASPQGHIVSRPAIPDPPPEKSAPIPAVMHFCAAHCNTLMWDKDHFTWSDDPGGSIWTVERFTHDAVIINRVDTRPRPYTAVYNATISTAGNTISGQGYAFTWGTALNSIPGTDEELNALQARHGQPGQAQLAARNLMLLQLLLGAFSADFDSSGGASGSSNSYSGIDRYNANKSACAGGSASGCNLTGQKPPE